MGTAVNSVDLNGIGMTSQRTRERLIQRLVDQGISNLEVLDIIRTTPRHMFLDEAMAHRAYEDTALPIGALTLDFDAAGASAALLWASNAHASEIQWIKSYNDAKSTTQQRGALTLMMLDFYTDW